MRQLLLLACLVIAAPALADEKLDAKELDKSSTNMSTTTATDYNSSRSNRIDAAQPADGPVDDDNDVDESQKTRAQDYNSSRSNTTSAVGKDKVEDTCDEDDENCSDVDKATEHQDGKDVILRKRPGR